MTKLGRLTTILCLSFGVLVLAASSWAQTRPPIAEEIAKTYGLDAWGQIEAIRYTWSGAFPGFKASRTWEWNLKTDTVSYKGKDKAGKPIKVSYQRSQLSSQSDVIKNEIDPAFINDQYWLIFPFHAVWDGAAVTDEGMHKLPQGKASARRVVVKYAPLGDDPGDTWELYVGADKRVEELLFRRGGTKLPKIVIATWAEHKKAGPLLIAMDHRGTADGKPLRIFFSNVSVKLVGSDTWVKAR